MNATTSQLVTTERGTGFLYNGELRKAHGIHVSPALREVRPATPEEASAFFQYRIAIKREMVGCYARSTFSGD